LRGPRAIGATALVTATLSPFAFPQASSAIARTVSGVRVLNALQYHFDVPEAIFPAGGRIWVRNLSGHYLTVLNATDGSLYTAVTGTRYELGSSQSAFAVEGRDVWTQGGPGNPLQHLLKVSGSSARVIRSVPVKESSIGAAVSMVARGDDLWASPATASGNGVAEVSLVSGRTVRVITKHVRVPDCIAIVGSHLLVFNLEGQSLSEYSLATGTFVRSVGLPGSLVAARGSSALNMVVIGSYLWLPDGSSVYEISLTSHKVLRTLSSAAYGFGQTQSVATDGTNLWFANRSRDSVTEVNAATGSVLAIFRGAPYDFVSPWSIAYYARAVWVTNAPIGSPALSSVTIFPSSS
jgi:hypothetical protein